MKTIKTALFTALMGATALAAGPTFAKDLRIALQSDADVLDPDQSRTFVGRIVYASMCDKLVDITPDLEIIPQLATGWETSADGKSIRMSLREGVVFHDGTPFNAEAVAANIERSQTLDESRRKSELKSITSTEVTGEHEIVLNLAGPDATLIAQLADRAGMMVSPTAAAAAGADFGLNPVCSGAFKFEERVAQDKIVLTKFDDYWNADAIHFDSVTFLPIPDTTVRLANLQSGDIDMLERLAATDIPQAQSDSNLVVDSAVSFGYQGITFNINNGDKGDNPWGNDKRLRQALSYAIDRNALNQVVFEGAYAPGNQSFPPNSPWYNSSLPVESIDLEKAKALLAEAGYPDGLDLEVQVPNSTEPLAVMQVVQAMAAQAGINIKLTSKEFATLLADQSAGDYTASQIGWSGRVDPDGNNHPFVTTDGGINDSKFSDAKMDELLNGARVAPTTEERKGLYDEAMTLMLDELPRLFLYHVTWIWAYNDNMKGFTPYPDGMIRLENVTWEE
ncbi:ABC transporter substrate-binding protein [Shimia sp. R9_1]|uniref:ABC transporter substrate-binding protein n=1 Tax=unclassified Shimia TaxID=2630038 RepID=UPI001ADC29A5|nr:MULTISPECIES: ABC transporter substrate-binding protein [unclassified Shimia]MBO9396757.1 ABC transporter substrate-binding protein [Shimia sp. R9_2]MBO9407986.1 ABC transporter substrate-binding protein [Shimia sp. R9_1]